MGGPEAPKAPEAANEEAAAAKKMGDVMPPMELEAKDEPIGAEELKELSKGYPEIDAKGHQDVMAAAKKGVKEALKPADNPHKSSFTVVGADGYEYVYIYDNTHTPNKDRLFRSKESVVEDEAKEYADATLNIGYTEVAGDEAKNIVKAITKLGGKLEGNPPSIVIDKSVLADNNLIDGLVDESENAITEWNVLYAVKIKGKTRVYLGWPKA